jgi:ABC-2 type transport system permease protein/ribosome-dependent ATPase
MNLGTTLAIARKEWREIVRDRKFAALAFLLPVLMMFVFGYGLNQVTEQVPILILDQDRSAQSRAYADPFIQQRTFTFVGYAETQAELERALAVGSARVGLVIPPGFGRALVSGRVATVQTLIDGAHPTTLVTRTLESYVQATSRLAHAQLEAGYVAARLGIDAEDAATLLRPLKVELRHRYNPDLIENWFTAPALVMFILIFAAPLSMALAVVREKETGAIYNLYCSTVRKSDFLLGKLLPNVAISLLNTLVLWALAVGVFGAPFSGSAAFFALGSLLYVTCVSGLGLVLSLLVRTQIAAMMISTMAAVVIGTQYSGMSTPIASLTGVSLWIARAMPPMYYLEIVHGTFLKGLGAAQLWPEALALAAYAVGLALLSLALFRKRVAA